MSDFSLALACNYKVIFNNFPEVEFYCKSIQLPSVNLDPMVLAGPTHTYQQPGNKLTFDPVTIVFLLDEEWKNWESILNWMLQFGPREFRNNTDADRSLSEMGIYIKDNHDKFFKYITFGDVWPLNLESPAMEASQQTSDPIEISATFQCNLLNVIS